MDQIDQEKEFKVICSPSWKEVCQKVIHDQEISTELPEEGFVIETDNYVLDYKLKTLVEEKSQELDTKIPNILFG